VARHAVFIFILAQSTTNTKEIVLATDGKEIAGEPGRLRKKAITRFTIT